MIFFSRLKKAHFFIFSGAVFLFFLAVGGAAYFLSHQKLLPIITINGTPINVVLAETPAERVRGLSGRETLPQNEGMLFLFENTDYHAFWMKNMRFPIDIIWMDDDRVIVGIAEHVLPS